MSTENTARENAVKATKRYLEAKGYEIQQDWEDEGLFGLIAMDEDEDELAFVQILFREVAEQGLPEEDEDNRELFERAAIGWLTSNGLDRNTLQVRFDVISLMILDGSHAFLRHHRNALAGTC